MVSGAKGSIESLTNQSRFASKPAQSTVNNAITRLDTALDQLAAPSPRPGRSMVDNRKGYLLSDDVKRYIDSMLVAVQGSHCADCRSLFRYDPTTRHHIPLIHGGR